VKLPPLILASASPRRAELLRQSEMEFKAVPSDAAEIADEQLSPRELCQLNAHRKARAVAKKIPDALVLGADTLVFLGLEIFGKPRDLDEAKRMLAKLQGRTHQVVTGVCLMHLRAHRERIFAVSTEVAFRPLTAGQISGYL
jgi:septum formation protein